MHLLVMLRYYPITRQYYCHNKTTRFTAKVNLVGQRYLNCFNLWQNLFVLTIDKDGACQMYGKRFEINQLLQPKLLIINPRVSYPLVDSR